MPHCFVGKYTQLFNSLSGYYTDFSIKISWREELNGRMATLIACRKRTNAEKKIEAERLIGETLETLDNVERLKLENERDMYLDVFDDE
jgi:hypothetical protein